MAQDVVPQLMSEIETAFRNNTMKDRTLASVSKRIRDGTATLTEGHTYAEHIGKSASKALQQVLTEKNLPDGRLYYNIANRTVVPLLESNQSLINEAAFEIQKIADAKVGINLNPVKPDFPKERVTGLIDKMTADGISLEDALIWIGEPIVNNNEAFYDDFVRENAEFRSNAGLKTKISRIAEVKACEWCRNLEGTYEYGAQPDDIFRRHEFCRCTVTVTSEKQSQSAWTKKSWKSTPEEIQRREGIKPEKLSSEERRQVLERLDKDKTVKQIMEATGYSRETANTIAGQSPSKIEKVLRDARKQKRG